MIKNSDKEYLIAKINEILKEKSVKQLLRLLAYLKTIYKI